VQSLRSTRLPGDGSPALGTGLLRRLAVTGPADPEPVRDFDDSTLWRVSEFERVRAETGTSGFARLGPSVLPTTLDSEFDRLRRERRARDVLEVVAACLRQRESALLLLRHRGLVWPLTLFPAVQVYHLPVSIVESLGQANADLEVLGVEPPGLPTPWHRAIADDRERPGYRPLAPLLWSLALHAPRPRLLDDIAGRAAYRLAPDFALEPVPAPGALESALRRLRSEIAPLAAIAAWPGMDAERALRLLNGVYLQGGLMVLRTHPAARRPMALHRWRGRSGP
jgi:hypothetical protein